jgi:hypothetical protein
MEGSHAKTIGSVLLQPSNQCRRGVGGIVVAERDGDRIFPPRLRDDALEGLLEISRVVVAGDDDLGSLLVVRWPSRGSNPQSRSKAPQVLSDIVLPVPAATVRRDRSEFPK